MLSGCALSFRMGRYRVPSVRCGIAFRFYASDIPPALANRPGPSWKTSGSAELTLRNWEGDYVVYNSLNGSTHVLDIVAGEVLKLVAAGRGQQSELCQCIAELLEVPNDTGIATSVGEILAKLDELGLIEPV